MDPRLFPKWIPRALCRPFRVLVFDWEGTAVTGPDADTSVLRSRVDRLLGAGVPVVVRAQASREHLDRRLADGLAGARKRHLYLATERGVEVWGFNGRGRPVGLRFPDEGDVLRWILEELVTPRRIPPEDVLVVGDFPVPEVAAGMVLASVAADLADVAEGAIHLGGGPARFDELLALQAALQPLEIPLSPTPEDAWLLVEHGSAMTREHEIESLLALSNGYLGTRASLAEGSPLSAPGTFLAGVYETGTTPDPELAHAFEWTRVAGFTDGHSLRIDTLETLEHRRSLDLLQGILWREWHFRDPLGRTTRLRGLRVACLPHRHALLQSIELIPENYSTRLRLETPFEGGRADGPDGAGPFVLARRTRGTEVLIAAAFAGHTETEDGDPIRREVVTRTDGDTMKTAECFDMGIEMGRIYRFDRFVSVHTSRDCDDPVAAARADVVRMRDQGLDDLLLSHAAAWRARWRIADVIIEGDAEAQRALRFSVYHLLAAANPHDERASIGARALTGEAYEGHVFWDTEIYLLPFYLHTEPDAARALLAYRYHTLPAARARAARLGYRGALYAWESADTGDDVTPKLVVTPEGIVLPVLAGEQEHHISADVAWGVWSYVDATGDDAFLRDMGAEILLETARFWASRGALGEDGRFHIFEVIGPDEYHDSVDDNAYTNAMARWNLERGAEAATLVVARWPERWRELSARLGVTTAEVERWRDTASRMYVGVEPETEVIEQFRGYFGLEDIDLGALEPRTAPVDVLLGHERVQRSQLIKQADAVMLLRLLGDRFSERVREATFRYYEPRTGHGSSLSPSMHALVAAQLGDVDLALRYFRQAASIDLANNMGNASGGVHIAASGGLWQAAVFGFAGLSFTEDGPTLSPRLPKGWRRMRLRVKWRGRTWDLDTSAPGRLRPLGEATA